MSPSWRHLSKLTSKILEFHIENYTHPHLGFLKYAFTCSRLYESVCVWSSMLNLTSLSLSLIHTHARTYSNTSTYVHENTHIKIPWSLELFETLGCSLQVHCSWLHSQCSSIPRIKYVIWCVAFVHQAPDLLPLLMVPWFSPPCLPLFPPSLFRAIAHVFCY